jgi:hypothetical protein
MGLPVGFENRLLSRNVQAKPKLLRHPEHAESPNPARWLNPADAHGQGASEPERSRACTVQVWRWSG